MLDDILSCDTFAIKAARSATGENFFAKNSDRPVGEAQGLRYYPAGSFEAGSMLQCTDLLIPQSERTYAVIGSQPYWIWGFEMGVNECGLCIGNEAEGSRCDKETETGLLGMDLLRLGLERAATAREAVSVITGLLERYGQNANASTLFDRRYENSFMLVDRDEILQLETAGREWVVREVKDWSAISNCYAIEKEFDFASANLEKLARDRRWLSPSEEFNFAKAYTLPADRQRNALPRCRRMQKIIGAKNEFSFDDAKALCRDHFEGELDAWRFGATGGTFASICMHAMVPTGPQTVASLLASYDAGGELSMYYAQGTPCLSVYLPFRFTDDLPACVSRIGGVYDDQSLWWVMERLCMAVSIDEERFGAAVRAKLSAFEKNAKDISEAEALMSLARELTEIILEEVRAEGGLYGPRMDFLREYTARVKMPLE